jgi:hypothetical protein
MGAHSKVLGIIIISGGLASQETLQGVYVSLVMQSVSQIHSLIMVPNEDTD